MELSNKRGSNNEIQHHPGLKIVAQGHLRPDHNQKSLTNQGRERFELLSLYPAVMFICASQATTIVVGSTVLSAGNSACFFASPFWLNLHLPPISCGPHLALPPCWDGDSSAITTCIPIEWQVKSKEVPTFCCFP